MKRHEELQLINRHIAEHGVYRARMGECWLGDGGITPRMATAVWAKHGKRGGKKNVRKKEMPKCAVCGEPCPKTVAKYCSKECYHAVHVQEKPDCVQCGNPVPRNGMKFCSRECSNSHRAVVYTLTCHTCGKEFQRKREKMKPNAKLHFCSRKCVRIPDVRKAG